jgi:hypothetical protein
MKNFAEELQVAAGFVPLDLAAAAQAGDWVSMKNYRHLAILVIKAAGAATEPATLTIEQATDVGGTTAKALNFTRADVKRGADLYTQGTFTKVTQTAGNTLAMDGTAGNTQALVMVEFNSEDLDGEGGYDCVRAKFADVGTTAQLAAILYILDGARYTPPPSAIID